MSGAGGWRDDLERWLQPFLAGLSHPSRRAMCPLYVAGLIGLGDRKSVQPMAARADGVPYDRLHHFIAAGIWDEAPLQQALLREADRLVGGSDAVLVVDDTALPKKGDRSVGVAPQYATTLGKTANCQTLVSLTLARGEVPVAVGLALFLPQTWTGDPDRMARAGVPKDLRAARTKLEIAVAEIDRLREGGVRFGCVLADAGYGCSAPFRQALSARGLRWAVGITGRNKVYPADVAMIFPVAGRGRARQHHVPDQVSVAAETILAYMTGRVVTWRHGTKGRLRARFCALRVRMADGPTQRIGAKGNQHLPGEAVWLVREERGSGERKFYLSNLPADATLKQLAATIKARWICEQAHQQMKEELGLDHFEGRSWTGLHRHALMTMIAYAFLQSRRLAAAERKKKNRLPTAPALDAGDPASHPGSPQPATATAMSAL
ncbi:IS701 family transposase [Methylobacterium sp. WL19]|uniref:IS701 family transposase n=1 Tax=Methylobacterium sp. WL19 TaxID=2603896 RepID=UPI001FEF3621|nr:IS701 family transposase [Methylobacterium sp. WL19]